MKQLLGCTALISGLALAMPAEAQPSGVRAGTLSCHEASGWGFVFGSSRHVRCTFTTGNLVEHYDGTISKFGVDLGYQQSAVLVWGVIAPTSNIGHGALNGDFAGVAARGAVGVGGGADILVGGSNNTISLQPFSIEGGTGLNVAAGIGALSLHLHEGE